MPSFLLQQVSPLLSGDERGQDFLPEKLTMLLLLRGSRAWLSDKEWPEGDLKQQWQQLLEASMVSIVESEVMYMRQQLQHIDDVLLEKKNAAEAAAACDTCELSPECHLKESMGVAAVELGDSKSSRSSKEPADIAAAAGGGGGGGEAAGMPEGKEVAAGGCCSLPGPEDHVNHACCS